MKLVIKKRKLRYICLLLYVFVVLSLPDGIKSMTSLYKMTTFGIDVTYTYNYYFSLLEIPIILIALIKYKYSYSIKFLKVFFLILILNIFYWILNMENVIQLHSYEMFLLLITGFSASVIVMDRENSLQDIDTILDWFTILQFALLILSMITGASGQDGRYAAIGMGSGATANIASYYLVWTFFLRMSKTKLFPAGIAFITVILTGSRTNLLVFVLIAIVFIGRLLKKQIIDGNGKKLLYSLMIIVPFFILGFMFSHGVKMESFERVASLFKGNIFSNITSDDSYLGRIRSIEGSLQILKENPNGLPFSIYALERVSARIFSMEYPHSTLLSYILLWSPFIAWGCMGYLVYLLIKAIRMKDNSAIFMFFNIVMLVFYGSPILYAKTYANLFVLVSYMVLRLKTISEIKNEVVEE